MFMKPPTLRNLSTLPLRPAATPLSSRAISLQTKQELHTMTRTNTSRRSEFIIPNGGSVKFADPPGSSPDITITFFAGTKRTTGLHWHETPTEVLRVAQGAACVETDGFVRVVTQRDAPVVIRPGVRHQFRRADRDYGAKGGEDQPVGVAEEELGEDPVTIESTDPADGDKEVFFRQVLNLLMEMKGNGIREIAWMLWSSFVVFHGHDNYPVVLKVTRQYGEGLGKALEWIITHSIITMAVILGRFVGLKSTYDEYTPVELREKVGVINMKEGNKSL